MNNLPNLVETLQNAKNILQYKSPVFILEQLEQVSAKVDKQQRKNTLRNTGLVNIGVITKNNWLLWRGQIPIPPNEIKRKPVDLIAKYSADPKKRDLLQRLEKKVKADFQAEGFRVINFEGIEDRLRQTSNAHHDLQRLQMGHGVTVEDLSCGCIWKIDLDGKATLVSPCPDYNNHLIKKPNDFDGDKLLISDRGLSKLSKYNLGITQLDLFCFDCLSKLCQDTKLVNQKGNVATISVCVFCPHCGTVYSEKKDVLSSQIVNLRG